MTITNVIEAQPRYKARMLQTVLDNYSPDDESLKRQIKLYLINGHPLNELSKVLIKPLSAAVNTIILKRLIAYPYRHREYLSHIISIFKALPTKRILDLLRTCGSETAPTASYPLIIWEPYVFLCNKNTVSEIFHFCMEFRSHGLSDVIYGIHARTLLDDIFACPFEELPLMIPSIQSSSNEFTHNYFKARLSEGFDGDHMDYMIELSKGVPAC